MTTTPRLLKFALTAHVIASVGWFGAVAGFLALAIAALSSQNSQMVHAACLAMELIGWFVLVPLGLASLLTGLVLTVGTPWGLFRHHWVLLKLLITIISIILLLMHMQPTHRLAGAAAATTLSNVELRGLRIQLVVDAGFALLALLVATTLSVYKPRGMTQYGQRKLQRFGPDQRFVANTPRWVYAFWIIAPVLLLAVRYLTVGQEHTR